MNWLFAYITVLIFIKIIYKYLYLVWICKRASQFWIGILYIMYESLFLFIFHDFFRLQLFDGKIFNFISLSQVKFPNEVVKMV